MKINKCGLKVQSLLKAQIYFFGRNCSVVYLNNPVPCMAGSRCWSLFQCSLFRHGAEMGWCRNGSLFWFPHHRSLSKRSSSSTRCSCRRLEKNKLSCLESRLVYMNKDKLKPLINMHSFTLLCILLRNKNKA